MPRLRIEKREKLARFLADGVPLKEAATKSGYGIKNLSYLKGCKELWKRVDELTDRKVQGITADDCIKILEQLIISEVEPLASRTRAMETLFRLRGWTEDKIRVQLDKGVNGLTDNDLEDIIAKHHQKKVKREEREMDDEEEAAPEVSEEAAPEVSEEAAEVIEFDNEEEADLFGSE